MIFGWRKGESGSGAKEFEPQPDKARKFFEHARTVGAGLLVSGGYGRSRFREFLLGGATRELLQGTHLPVLFSH